MKKVFYGTRYNAQGYLVEVVKGAKVRSLSGPSGPVAVIDVKAVEGFLAGQSWSELVDNLKEVIR